MHTVLRQALARMIRVARRLAGPRRPAGTGPAPDSSAPDLSAKRLARTAEWIVAFARVLAGDRFYHRPIIYRFPGRYPSLTADLRELLGLPALPPPTEAQRAAGRLCTLRRVFATQPTGVIAARLARRIGLTPADPAWPHALIGIATPPAHITRGVPPAAAVPGRRPRQTIRPVTLPRLPTVRAAPLMPRKPRAPPFPS